MSGLPNLVTPSPVPCGVAAVGCALVEGWRMMCRVPGLSLAYGGIFALIGTLALGGIQWLRLAPLTIPLFGGFLLIGPVVMAGLLVVAETVRAGRQPGWRDVFHAWRTAPRGVWAMAFFCMLVFFIEVGDVGTLYSFLVGKPVGGIAAIFPQHPLWSFHLSAAASGGALAVAVFVVTVHAVPLLVTRRATLVGAVMASTRAVFCSPLAHLVWAGVIALGVFGTVFAPPLLALVLPVLAYSGSALHSKVFPSGDESAKEG